MINLKFDITIHRWHVVAIIVALVLLKGGSVAFAAWTGPTAAPAGNNSSAPINVSTTDQVKNAGLSVNSLAVFGNSLLSGTSRYLNFGTIAGTTGYGIRDNAGTMEIKSTSGSWQSIPTAVQAAETDPQVGTLTNGQWCTSDGSTISCTSAAPAGGITAVTSVSADCGTICSSTATCPAGWFRTGCGGTNSAPSGSNACRESQNTGQVIYAYCAR